MYMLKGDPQSRLLIGRSIVFLEETNKIPIIAGCDSSVLISGETGTGKELFTRKIHDLSPRAQHPFVPVNCGAIPVELAENELFGHHRGAFTGAVVSKPGLIKEAEGGTLFLDEIDSLPALVQVKLLRFLQERTYRPLGSSKECSANVRVIAATSGDAEDALRSGRIRQDLYYRLNVISLRLPPLRERQEDIPLLARHFVAKYAAQLERHTTDLSPAAVRKLLMYDWPGNVRELEHVIERAIVLSSNKILQESDIFLSQRQAPSNHESFKEAKDRFVTQFEKAYIQKLLLAYRGNISQAARVAQKNRRAFWELIRKHSIDVESFK